MSKRLIFLLCFAFQLLPAFPQSTRQKIYFDKSGRSCQENVAYYFRQETDTPSFYRSFFTLNGRLAFQGKIKSVSSTDESKNSYTGKCSWYYKNGNVRQLRSFTDEGLETGISKTYYESGKIWKEVEYLNGKPSQNFYTEYNEDGARNRIFEEDFNDNHNEWDLFLSDKSTASIESGQLRIVSFSKEGTSRYINLPVESRAYTIEADLNILEIKDNEKVGIIYGFKDWQNYHYFAISKKYVYIGTVYEGVKAAYVDAMYCAAINYLQNNNIKIICDGENNYFSVNGEVQYKDHDQRLYGSNFGFVLSGNSKIKVDRFLLKELNLGISAGIGGATTPDDNNIKATGSGVLFGKEGYILTNYHVVENSSKFVVELNSNSGKTSYKAEVVLQDKDNDLAILKIRDDNFKNFPEIGYAFKENGQIDVGAGVFTIGYPHALTGMGKEAKFTDGKISAKTGYNGVLNSFQTTIPVQPGNSGGPVFNDSGQLIGVINATFKEADNVSYAIRLNYIKNLIELLPEKVELPANNVINSLSLEEKLKVLTNYVVLVKVK